MTYTRAEQDQLLAMAHQSIEYGFSHGEPIPIEPQDYPESLQACRASFVTL